MSATGENVPSRGWSAPQGRVARHVPESDWVVLAIKPSPLFILLAPLRAMAIAVVIGVIVFLAATAAHRFAAPGIAAAMPNPAVVASATGVLSLLRLLWQVLEYLARLYVLTDRRVIRVGGVLRQRIVEAPVERIQHVVLYRSLRERLTGLRSIGFATAGTGHIEVVWFMVPQRVGGEDVVRTIRRVIDKPSATGHSSDSRSAESSREGGGVPRSGAGLSSASEGVDAASSGQSSRARPLVIGLAGGIGAGKSAVARVLESLGCLVSDSDTEAKAQLDNPEVRDQLVKWWGDRVLDSQGRVQRSAVAEIVFSDPGQRKRLEELVHPRLKRARGELIEEAARAGAPAVIIDAPLLFEAGVDAECDAVIFVDASRRDREARVAARGWAPAELERREDAQLPLDEKRRRSTHVIENTGSEASLTERTEATLRKILGEAGPR